MESEIDPLEEFLAALDTEENSALLNEVRERMNMQQSAQSSA